MFFLKEFCLVILHFCAFKDLIVIFLGSISVEGLKIRDAFFFYAGGDM